MRCFGCGAERHQSRSCPDKCAAQSAQPAATGGAASEAPRSFAAAMAGPVAPVPIVALAEGAPPTVEWPSVVEAPVEECGRVTRDIGSFING